MKTTLLHPRRAAAPLALAAIFSTIACTDGPTGGVTARLVIDTEARGVLRRALRAAEVPAEIGRLEITALDAAGTTLATTVLALAPAAGEQQLVPAGGTWRLDGVSVGDDRVLRARAFLAPELGGALALEGEKRGIVVRAGETTDAGTVTLTLLPDVRLPSLDRTPPAPPLPITVQAIAEGGALRVSWSQPADPDTGGYVVAYTATASTGVAPEIQRGRIAVGPGEMLSPGVVVGAWINDPAAGSVILEGLTDLTTYQIFVYAFDLDAQNRPLNYSAAAAEFGSPRDTSPPAAPVGFTVTASGTRSATLRFEAPGEDGTMGLPVRYEVRAAVARGPVTDPAQFVQLREIEPPPVAAPGTQVTFLRTFEELGVDGGEIFFVGVRAIDAAGNAGPISVAQYAVNPNLVPVITAAGPEVAIAGAALSLSGALFGARTGTVTLEIATSTSSPISLPINAWRDQEISVRLPPDARSGLIVVERASDGARSEPFFVPVIARVPGELAPFELPFEAAGAPLAPDLVVTALLDFVDTGGQFELAIERLFNETNEDVRHAPLVSAEPFSALAATYSLPHDRFLFLASTAIDQELHALIVSTSTLTPLATRRTLAGAGRADGLGIAILSSTVTPNALPAVIALSSDGRVLAGTVADLATDGLGPLTVVATAAADLATVLYAARGSTAASELVIAYRSGGPTDGRLAVHTLRGDGTMLDDLVELAPGRGPELGGRIRLIDAPGAGVVVAYEERLADGRTDLRLLPISLFGQGPGLAPLPALGPSDPPRRLEDVGLVERDGGEVWIAVASSRPVLGGRQLNYTEIDPMQLAASGRSGRRGVDLELFLAEAEARLGCKPYPMPICPLIWNGVEGPSLLFVRR